MNSEISSDFIKKWQVRGVIFTSILGVILHFTYNLTGQNPFVALFSAVNESTWEHLKLLYFPVLFFAILEYSIYGKDIDNFLCVKALSTIIGMAAIVITFYTYTGILGRNFAPLDISTFFMGVIISYYFSYKFLNTDKFSSTDCNYVGTLLLFVLTLCFFIFTILPPDIGIFHSPV